MPDALRCCIAVYPIAAFVESGGPYNLSQEFVHGHHPQIRTRFLEGFPEKKADLLARVVIEVHDDLVNQADFHALTGVVKELADEQKEFARA